MKLKEFSPQQFFRCIIHQHVLSTKILSWDLIMKDIVFIINFIQRNGLNHRQVFLLGINSDYGDVLYYTAIRWLRRGRKLERFLMLRQEMYHFLKKKNKMKRHA